MVAADSCLKKELGVQPHRHQHRRWGLFSDMADGRAISSEQPNLRPRDLRDVEAPSETVPEEVRKLWDLLPRRERQRRRRRWFRAHPACCSRPVAPSSLASLDARVRILEEALAEFLCASAASVPVPPTRSAKKRDRDDAVPPSPPAPTNTVGETLSGIRPATESVRTADPPPTTTSNSTSAAFRHDLHGAALHGADSPGEPPHGEMHALVNSAVSHGAVSRSMPPLGAAPHGATSVTGTAPVPSNSDPHLSTDTRPTSDPASVQHPTPA